MNSLMANNCLSQQLAVSVAEHLLLRHKCRLPNHLAVSNYRELYLTVGDELCRNSTTGFVTEEGFMSMLFAGNQKHSALSIFIKTTRMSALVLHENSDVILLSVKDHQHIDSAIPRCYTIQASHKTGAGYGNPEFTKAHNRAPAVFLCHEQHYVQVMAGCAGPISVGPGSLVTGISTPIRLTTNKVVESLGGELLEITKEAAIMATIPILTQPEVVIVNGQAATSSLAVANFFSKRHDDVLKKIRTPECSASFTARNFSVGDYTDYIGRKLPCYQIARDGFAFLVVGFTGKHAAQFKGAYINASNQMEKQLSNSSVLNDVAHNASVLYSYISSIHQVWLRQLYPMLAKAESPLAISLYGYINDASVLACLINLSPNPSEVRGRK